MLLTDAPIERLRTLQSNHYSDEEEREAEMLASLILERVNNAQADNAIKDPNISGTLQWTQPYESPGILARSVASGYGKAMFCPHPTRQRGIRATAEAVYLSQLRMLRAYRSLLHRVYEPPTVARWRGWKVRSPPCHS